MEEVFNASKQAIIFLGVFMIEDYKVTIDRLKKDILEVWGRL